MRTTLALITACLFAGCFPEMPKDQAIVRFVYDMEDLLSPEEEAELEGMLKAYEQRTTNEIVILTYGDTSADSSLIHMAEHLHDSLGVGKTFKRNGMVLAYSDANDLIFSLTEENIAATNDQASLIQDSVIIPLLSEERVHEALMAGAEAFMALADSTKAQKLREREERKQKRKAD
jgi:uncharacterized protein